MRILAVLTALLQLAGGLFAANTASEALAERLAGVGGSFSLLGNFFATAYGRGAGAASASHNFAPATARHGLFRMDAEFYGGFTLPPLDRAVTAQGLPDAGVKRMFETAPLAPVPMAGLKFHMGLPGFGLVESMDAGLRLSGFGLQMGGATLEFGDTGLDLRANILEEGLVYPLTLSTGLSVDGFRGRLLFVSSQSLSDTATVPGYRITGNLSERFEVRTENTAVTLRLLASRQLLFLRPWAGLAAQFNSGHSETSFEHAGTLSATHTAFPADTAGGNAALSRTVAGSVDPIDYRLAAGLQVKLAWFFLAGSYEKTLVSTADAFSVDLGVFF